MELKIKKMKVSKGDSILVRYSGLPADRLQKLTMQLKEVFPANPVIVLHQELELEKLPASKRKALAKKLLEGLE